MRLSELTLSGFKSFAKTTTLSFPAAVSAIVGPNGSGKSNVAEAIRWVLGEQSMKSLRGKRGEDLIFSGSPAAARMGKAAAALSFDNRDHALPLDFDTVTIERKIFRDGTNEYYLSGSQVRLKDVVELIARIGLGETKHNIIGQGEVDRILLASPRERRDILEEAIGLRLWQLKKREAEKKLGETDGNAGQVSALLKEISPHLKFLKTQAEKAEKRETLRKELEDYYRTYTQTEHSAIAAAEARLRHEAEPALGRTAGLEREITGLRQTLQAAESGEGSAEALRGREEESLRLETKRRELERELGRIEGRLETAHSARRGRERVAVAEVEAMVQPFISELTAASAFTDIGQLRANIASLAERLSKALADLKRHEGRAETAAENLTAERGRIQSGLQSLEAALGNVRAELAAGIQDVRAAQVSLRERFEELREREEELTVLKGSLQRIGFEKEKLDLRRSDLERVISESGLGRDELLRGTSPFGALAADELKRKIERSRARLEEIGGIDATVQKEYQDTKTRHDFLERELNDLNAASKDLRDLITELEDRIERDFQAGFAKIKNEFHHYFRIIFGGGKGVLAYVPLRRAEGEEENGDDDGKAEGEIDYGIDIEVDLPRKRIKGLAMLSGGERALVSIALLFAITAVNPPPFLVLDETDAALDEANSQKYGAILKELSKKTQLILVTHNRETMQRAGILYGVTMGEDGVSRILSLKLEEAEAYGNR